MDVRTQSESTLKLTQRKRTKTIVSRYMHLDSPELLGTQLLICLPLLWIRHGHWDVWNYCLMTTKTFCAQFRQTQTF